MHRIVMNRVINGYRVEVGCMEFVFNSFGDLIEELTAYHEHPQETEEKWIDVQQKLHMAPSPVGEDPPSSRAQTKTLAEEGAARIATGAVPVGGGGLIGQ